MLQNSRGNRYQELDALRGIAALIVVFFHYTLHRPEANLGFRFGVTGVDLFFVISGFVIYMSLNKVNTSVEFIINRTSRLYPTYWACVTFTFTLILIRSIYNSEHADFIKYAANMTMFQYYFKIGNLDGPYWTMIIEMIFYVAILLLFQFKLLKYLNIIGTISSVFAAALFSFAADNIIVKKIFWAIPLLQFIPLFFSGTIFYKIYTDKKKQTKRYLILVLCLICQALLFEAGRSREYISLPEYVVVLLIYYGVFTLFVNNKLKFIVTKGTLFLGKISFALYLIHQYISIKIIIPYLVDTLHFNFWISSLLIALPVVILLASFVTYCIEIPYSKRMKEMLRKGANLYQNFQTQ